MDNQRVNRRRRNLPAELKVEIVDCFPLENAVYFLANVPNRLIIHHCAPRVRRILKVIYQISADYARRILLVHNFRGRIRLMKVHRYTPEMEIFLRHGAAHCNYLSIWRGIGAGGYGGYPANFFNDLINYSYETKIPEMAVRHLDIKFPWANPVPWPAALLQASEMKLKRLKRVNNGLKFVRYILRNKHYPAIAFTLWIHFDGGAKCYQQMTRFVIWRVEIS